MNSTVQNVVKAAGYKGAEKIGRHLVRRARNMPLAAVPAGLGTAGLISIGLVAAGLGVGLWMMRRNGYEVRRELRAAFEGVRERAKEAMHLS